MEPEIKINFTTFQYLQLYKHIQLYLAMKRIFVSYADVFLYSYAHPGGFLLITVLTGWRYLLAKLMSGFIKTILNI